MTKADAKVNLEVGQGQDIRVNSGFIISGLSGGHGVFHWFNQSFLVVLPEIQTAFGLSEVGVGAIATIRELTSGLVSLPGGVIVDSLRRHWGLVLALCMAAFGLGWLLVGMSAFYPLLLVGMVVVASSSSMWHLPAMASLSSRFSERRGTALSLHGIGGNVGDALGPVATGFLLAFLSWGEILSMYALVPLLLALVVFWAFKDIGRGADVEPSGVDLGSQIRLTKLLMRNKLLWGITFVAGVRGMAFVTFVTFLPLYMDNELGMSSQARGLHIGLLVLMGIVFTPVMGYLSDRVGRKLILVPGLLILGGLTVLLGAFGEGGTLVVLIGLVGIFLYSDQPILTAMALDIVGQRVATTTLGTLSFSRFALSAVSPLIGGSLYQNLGIEATFYYVGALLALAALSLLLLPVKVSDVDMATGL